MEPAKPRYGPLFPMPLQRYRPKAAPGFSPERVILSKGTRDGADRRDLATAICAAYPQAEVVEQFDVPHNRIDLGSGDALALHRRGKRTLVLGVHASAVRQSTEDGNTCPNYWHFSPYGFCPHGCHYCYLDGTPGVRFSPTVKIFLNLPEILCEIDRVAMHLSKPTAFYLGKLQDGLTLDPLTGYSGMLVPFFAAHPFARMTLLTKSANVENLLDLHHAGHTILSWSLNPAEVIAKFEANTPSLAKRIEAMKRCAAAGYPIRAVIMPLVPASDWETAYATLLQSLLSEVPLERITLGGICSYPAARNLMERKLGRSNAISGALDKDGPSRDGRLRYPKRLRIQMYGHLIEIIRRLEPDLDVGLCLEEQLVFEALDLTAAISHCNCVL